MQVSNTDNDQVILVNEADDILGYEDKLIAHQKGLLHRAFSVCILREDPALGWLTLLQQRHFSKYHCGSLWSNTCCSHPRPNETTLNAAKRRLQEEMGLHLDLNEAGSFMYQATFDNGLIEHEFDHVFYAITTETDHTPCPNETMNSKWVSLNDLLTLSDKEKNHYTPWMQEALSLVKENTFTKP